MIPILSDTEGHKSPEWMREKILQLEDEVRKQPQSVDGSFGQIHIEPVHYFAPGLYLREITIPKNVMITGHIHKTEHFCILSQGEVAVYTEDGMKRLKAPATIHCHPGIKRVLYAIETAVWTNVHHNPSDERDLDKILEIYTAKTFEEALGHDGAPKQIAGRE